MPIQVKYVDGKPMFRWGTSGKWYRTRAEAEAQARAAYAAGYKEKKDEQK